MMHIEKPVRLLIGTFWNSLWDPDCPSELNDLVLVDSSSVLFC